MGSVPRFRRAPRPSCSASHIGTNGSGAPDCLDTVNAGLLQSACEKEFPSLLHERLAFVEMNPAAGLFGKVFFVSDHDEGDIVARV